MANHFKSQSLAALSIRSFFTKNKTMLMKSWLGIKPVQCGTFNSSFYRQHSEEGELGSSCHEFEICAKRLELGLRLGKMHCFSPRSNKCMFLLETASQTSAVTVIAGRKKAMNKVWNLCLQQSLHFSRSIDR